MREENKGIWSRNIYWMFLCCAIPLGGIALLSFFNIVGPWGLYTLILLCPLIHFFLMRRIVVKSMDKDSFREWGRASFEGESLREVENIGRAYLIGKNWKSLIGVQTDKFVGRCRIGKRVKRGSGKIPRRIDKQRRISFLWIGGIIAGVVIIGVSLAYLKFNPPEVKKGKSFFVRGGETRPVLDPSLFTGMASSAYAAARENPRVMDQVFCYCACDEPPVNHKSLLSCFVENHGAGWLLCQKEALRAAKLFKEGKSIEAIKRAVDDEFSG